MTGIIYVESATAEATTGQMLVTLTSGDAQFQFHLPAHVALHFRERIIRNAWQVCCAPPDPISMKHEAKKRTKAKT